MKKKEVKFLNITQGTDLEKELAELAESGWELKHMVGTPVGLIKGILYRDSDDEVTSSAKTDELMKKWA